MAPVYAVPRMLDRAGLELQDFDIYEIHEAFAAQVLCTLKAWESDDYCRKAQASGAPRLDRSWKAQSQGLERRHRPSLRRHRRPDPRHRSPSSSPSAAPGRGLISICAAGGMGVTAILER